MTGPYTNTGHGHVWSRPDGVKARCGGPPICAECARHAKEYLGIDRFEKGIEGARLEKQQSALSSQIGGDHYKTCVIQPVQYIEANNLSFLEGCVVKRVTRHDKPTGKGRQDIEKAIHELQLLLEHRYGEDA